jgi:predicted acyltransferase
MEGEFSIELNTQCGKRLGLNIAEWDVTLSGGQALWARNTACYECADYLVYNGSAPSWAGSACAQVFYAEEWDLYLHVESGGEWNEVAFETYGFGEHGRYTIVASPTALTINETSPPVDTDKPLWVAAIILVCIIMAYRLFQLFLLPPLKSAYDDWKTRNQDYASVDTKDPLRAGLMDASDQAAAGAAAKPRKERLVSLDAFRGFTLCLMIFVNYGAGGYWFLDHSAWNGVTPADLLFPWFIFMMGVSMYLSFRSQTSTGASKWDMWSKVVIRACKLFALGLFLNNGYHYSKWRIPGVLQYFGVAYLATSATVFCSQSWVAQIQSKTKLDEATDREKLTLSGVSGVDTSDSDRAWCFGLYNPIAGDRAIFSYWPEWVIQGLILLVYVSIHLGAKAPGCPRGYIGPGGLADNGDNWDCTGGIHRYIDVKLFGADHFYGEPTCVKIYDCISYDPEGALGSLSACTLTYLGLMTGRVLYHYEGWQDRLKRWAFMSFTLLLLAGILCGFSKEEGVIPVNKNLWSTSFIFLTGGSGIFILSIF